MFAGPLDSAGNSDTEAKRKSSIIDIFHCFMGDQQSPMILKTTDKLFSSDISELLTDIIRDTSLQ